MHLCAQTVTKKASLLFCHNCVLLSDSPADGTLLTVGTLSFMSLSPQDLPREGAQLGFRMNGRVHEWLTSSQCGAGCDSDTSVVAGVRRG